MRLIVDRLRGAAKLTLTFDIPGTLAERLAARAVREGVNIEAVVLGLLQKARAQ